MRPSCKLALALAALPLLAQDARPILVPFHVAKDGHQVVGLTRDDILLLEDGAPKRISYFAGPSQSGLNALFEVSPARPAAPTELIVLLNSREGSTLTELRYPPEYRQPPYGGVNGSASFAAWLKGALLDRVEGSRISVYGFDKTLQRYCRPTRDSRELEAGLRSADKGSRGTVVASAPDRGGLSWDLAIVGASEDAVGAGANAVRIMLPFLRGLPGSDARPLAVARRCEELGIAVYPMFRDLAWPAVARQSSRGFEEYAKLGDETGGRSGDPHHDLEPVLSDIEQRVRSVYAAGFTPDGIGGAPQTHKLEVRLRDSNSGALEGGTRTAVY